MIAKIMSYRDVAVVFFEKTDALQELLSGGAIPRDLNYMTLLVREGDAHLFQGPLIFDEQIRLLVDIDSFDSCCAPIATQHEQCDPRVEIHGTCCCSCCSFGLRSPSTQPRETGWIEQTQEFAFFTSIFTRRYVAAPVSHFGT